MKITPEVLKAMGFTQQKNSNGHLIDVYYLTIGDCLFTMKDGPETWRFYGPRTMEPNYRAYVTDLEQLLLYTYEYGREGGREDLKKELHKLIGVKNGCD